MSIFKAYDVRGLYPQEFDAELVYRIGYFLPRLLRARSVAIGRDCRLSSPEIFAALSRGLCDGGADVYDLGLATTPMVYFATAHYGFDASVQITASHNPPQYNGFKISRKEAIPVGYDTGLAELQRLVSQEPGVPRPAKGTVRQKNVRDDYLCFLRKFVPRLAGLRIGIDCSNGMTGPLIRELLCSDVLIINEEPDGRFPQHEPNPLLEENLRQIQSLIGRERLDLGVVFDGDGDRVVFVDERGHFVRPDIMIAALGEHYLRCESGIVLHDIRTSRAVVEHLRRLGGIPYMWKVGHAHAKLKLRELGAIYGGELAGHYYFRDFFNCDSGILACLLILLVLAKMKAAGRPLSAFVAEFEQYANSGELNFRIEDKTGAMERIRRYFLAQAKPLAIYDFDGYRIEFEDWWFNVRPSNTEPYLRLIAEAKTEEILHTRLAEIRSLILTESE